MPRNAHRRFRPLTRVPASFRSLALFLPLLAITSCRVDAPGVDPADADDMAAVDATVAAAETREATELTEATSLPQNGSDSAESRDPNTLWPPVARIGGASEPAAVVGTTLFVLAGGQVLPVDLGDPAAPRPGVPLRPAPERAVGVAAMDSDLIVSTGRQLWRGPSAGDGVWRSYWRAADDPAVRYGGPVEPENAYLGRLRRPRSRCG